MYSDFVLYNIAVQHQKDLLHEIENHQLSRQIMAGNQVFGMVAGLPHKVSDVLNVWKNRTGKPRRP
jgi:hypothetical protein